MQQLVGQAPGELGEDVLGAGAIGKQTLGLAQLIVANPLGMLAVGLEHIHCGQLAQALHEILGPGGDQLLGGLGSTLTALEVFRDHLVQVVDGVEIDIIQLADLWLPDVPRHGDIDHEHRLVRAASAPAPPHPLPRIGSWLAVELMTMSLLCSSSGMSASRIACAPSSAARALARSRYGWRRRSSSRPARAGDAPPVMVSPAPISSAWLRCRLLKICRARLTAAKATDTGFSPMAVSVRTVLAVLKVAGTVVRAAGRYCRPRGRLRRQTSSAENLRLAQHQRVEPGGDAHHVTHSTVVDVHIGAGLEFVEAEAVIVGQPGQYRVGFQLILLQIELAAIAGRKNRGLASLA